MERVIITEITEMRKCFILFLLLIVLTSPFLVRVSYAADVTFIKEYTYMASDLDSKVSSRAIALEQVKRALLEQLGTYLISETEVKNYQMTKDQVTTLTAGIVSAEVLDEKWDGRTYYMKAQIAADPKEIAKSVDAFRNDKQKSKDLEESKKIAENALKEVERLNKVISTAKANAKQQDEYNAAIRELSAVDSLDKGYALFKSDDIQGTIDSCSKAIELNPRLWTAYALRGLAYSVQADWGKVADDSDMVIKLEPNNAIGYFLRGLSYVAFGINDKAIQDLSKSIRLNPKNDDAFSNRGYAYARQKKNKHAIADANSAIALNPRNADA